MAPSSLDDLRARIEDISSAITRQRSALRDLEKAKSELQRHLNAILDPITRLPLEISSDIFLRCLPATPSPSHDVSPTTFLGVCHSWSDIALATPSLWAAFHVHRESSGDIHKVMELWFSRAHPRALSISLHGDLDPDVCDAVHENAQRVESLELYFPSSDELAQITTPFPCLKNLTVGPAISEEAVDQESYPDFYSEDGDECVAMLCASPNLVECTFEAINFRAVPDDLSISSHPSLRHLHFTSLSSVEILRYLTLPALESLWIPSLDISDGQFLDFLTRSSPLRCLRLTMPTFVCLVKSLDRLAPNLVELDLTWCDDSDFLDELIGYLSQALIPNLRSLTLRQIRPEPSQYESLVGLISGRQSRLRTVRLLWPYSQPIRSPDAGTIAALRELVAHGMEIHVGMPEDTNQL
ncbi:hypothetical protein C8R43DRAFT_1031662 [Mycena crocata]|nr:hypothetical protein C8R43DRAFT_1031662 [Mycena crocata]